MGVIMRQTKDEDNQGTLYGFLPKMAMSSEGGIRSLMASSFYERINSCANLVLTEGNTWLSDEEMGKLVMLRMNKRFMAFMMKYLLPVTTLSAVSSRLSLGFLSLPYLPSLLVCHLASRHFPVCRFFLSATCLPHLPFLHFYRPCFATILAK